MAASGSFKTDGYQGRYLVFSWQEISQSIAYNTTTISWTLKGAGTASSGFYYTQNIKVVIAGQVVYNRPLDDGQIELWNGTTVASGNYTLTHNDDGTKSFTASAEAGIYSWAVNCTGSGTFTLDTIARASQPSCVTYPNHTQNVGNFGVSFGIHMNRKSSAFTHTVRYAYGSRKGTIATNVDTGVTWAVPLDFMNDIPNAVTGSGTIYVDTYNGSTFVGTKSCGFTASVPTTVKPSCTIQVLDNTPYQDLYGSLVKGLSQLYVKTNFYSAYSSPATAYNVTANGVRYTDNEIVTGVLTKAGTTTITATVTDKRGRTSNAVSASFTVIDYNSPSVTKLSATRCDEDGTANKRGAYIKVTFSASVSSMNEKNTALYKLLYKPTTNSLYAEVSLTALAGNYAVTDYEYIFAASAGKAYDILIQATDRHSTQSKSTKAPTAFAIFSWRGFKSSSETVESVGVGKVPEKPGYMEVAMTLEVEKPIELKDEVWQTATLTSAFKPYGGAAGNTPLFRKTASNVVEVRGTVSPANASNPIGSNETTIICTLPEGYRPSVGIYSLCQGSGNDVWLLSVATDGTVGASRHRSGGTSTTPSTSAWLPFYVVFVAS